MTDLRCALLIVTCIALGLTGCISSYRYESHGTVIDSAGNPQGALIYWSEDDGRLWYGKRHRSRESDLDLKVCNAIDKSFVPIGGENLDLSLKSRGGEFQTASLNSEPIDDVTDLDPEVRLRPNQSCGAIIVDGVEVGMAELNEGETPLVALLCRGEEDPTVYPTADLYQFSEITRTKITKDRHPSSPCPEAPPSVSVGPE